MSKFSANFHFCVNYSFNSQLKSSDVIFSIIFKWEARYQLLHFIFLWNKSKCHMSHESSAGYPERCDMQRCLGRQWLLGGATDQSESSFPVKSSFCNNKSNQIKSLLLSHHHSTSALVSEILESVLQTVQKKQNNLHIDSTYLQTVQKTMCKIHIHILNTHSVL